MSVEYNKYIVEHKNNIIAGYKWLADKCPDLIQEMEYLLLSNLYSHDASKYSDKEYAAYDKYFYEYSNKKKPKEIRDAFNLAWLHHIHNNPHHWQYWVLVNDDSGTIALDMPSHYILEMILDWWSFSWKSNNLYEVFDWYETHKEKMILSDTTRLIVEYILSRIKDKLDEVEVITDGSEK